MTMGHYATALIPWSRSRSWPLWLLLICAQLGDLLWLVLTLAGIEKAEPHDILDVSMLGLQTEMLWSHGLATVLLQAALVAAVVFAAYKDRALAAWCGALVVGHLLCDFVCGWKHEIAGAGSLRAGLGMYESSPSIFAAYAIEAAFGAACVWWFVRRRDEAGERLSTRARAALYGVFSGGALLLVGTTTHSLRDVLAQLR